MLNILLLEPFFTGSHRQWALQLQEYSCHNIEILQLSGHHWKWRMHGGAISLAHEFNQLEKGFDLIITTDMLDLSLFHTLTKSKTHSIPFVLYFHENQLTYPWSPSDKDVKLKRDNHYAFINYSSALVADHIIFNSHYHKTSFINALPNFLNQFPDYKNIATIADIGQKSSVLPVGINFSKLQKFKHQEKEEFPLILWNHRWEFDKNPEDFFSVLYHLSIQGYKFKLAVLGESFPNSPKIFENAKKKLAKHIVQWGYCETFEKYAYWLWKADIIPVTSNQDFFGISTVEAILCDTTPLLPNRLAFPEHLPKKHLNQNTYGSNEELANKLNALIDSHTLISQEIVEHNKRYSWNDLIHQYNEFFNQIAKA